MAFSGQHLEPFDRVSLTSLVIVPVFDPDEDKFSARSKLRFNSTYITISHTSITLTRPHELRQYPDLKIKPP